MITTKLEWTFIWQEAFNEQKNSIQPIFLYKTKRAPKRPFQFLSN